MDTACLCPSTDVLMKVPLTTSNTIQWTHWCSRAPNTHLTAEKKRKRCSKDVTHYLSIRYWSKKNL